MVRRALPRCNECPQGGSKLFCRLSGPVAERFERTRSALVFRRGQGLFYEGEPAHSLFVVCSGMVKVFTSWIDGEEQVLRLLGPGEIIGYRPLLAGDPYNASAEAVEDSAVCMIPGATVRELIRDDPDFALELLTKLATELRVSEGLMMDLLRRPVRQRVARLLLGLLPAGRDGSGALAIEAHGLRRKDMARMIATSPETFSRALRSLARRGILEFTRDVIEVRELESLRRLAGEAGPPALDRGQERR